MVGIVAKMVVVVVGVIVAWLALWRSWWWRLLFAWRFVAMVVQNNDGINNDGFDKQNNDDG